VKFVAQLKGIWIIIRQ